MDLLEKIARDVEEADRRDWLTRQVIALRTQAEGLTGLDRPYLEVVERGFDWTPHRRHEAVFDAAAAQIDDLLPGDGPLAARLEAWDDRFVIPKDRLAEVATWLIERFRARAAELFGLPEGEELRIRLVSKQPWSGYNWFDGARRSRVEINTDLPTRASELIHVVAHESYPGHHLEHAWKEAELVDRRRRMESSILLINTPECLISEGLADLGHRFASPANEEAALLMELYERAGLPIARDSAAALEAARTTVALAGPRRVLTESRVNAALRRHADGESHDAVLAWLERVGRYAPSVATKRLEFIEHPSWRTYVFVYHEGEALLRRWLDAVAPEAHPARFARLLREQLTPTAIATEAGLVNP
jgi:hypothetical protein